MSNPNDLTCLVLPLGRNLSADETESRLSLILEGQPLIQLRLERNPEPPLRILERYGRPVGQALWAACYWLFARDPECQRLTSHSPISKPIGQKRIASRHSMTPLIMTVAFICWSVRKEKVDRLNDLMAELEGL